MQRRRTVTFCAMWVAAALLLVGCASLHSRNYGMMTLDSNVKESFETYQVYPNYNYYVSGPDFFPHAILGLDKAYKLESDLWKPVDMTASKLREIVSGMKETVRHLDVRLTLYGFALIDDKGKQIGIWYSINAATTSLWTKDDNTVIIITPPIDTYFRYNNW